MKSHAKVVVIGGGVVGVSALYHLAKKGWGDEVVLLEKAELTSGSTWHAAGLLPLFNMSYSVGQVHKYSVNLYQELETETGQPVGFSQVGNLRLAMNDDRLEPGERCASTSNRNFEGRQGKGGRTHLVSPAMAAAAAVHAVPIAIPGIWSALPPGRMGRMVTSVRIAAAALGGAEVASGRARIGAP